MRGVWGHGAGSAPSHGIFAASGRERREFWCGGRNDRAAGRVGYVVRVEARGLGFESSRSAVGVQHSRVAGCFLNRAPLLLPPGREVRAERVLVCAVYFPTARQPLVTDGPLGENGHFWVRFFGAFRGQIGRQKTRFSKSLLFPASFLQKASTFLIWHNCPPETAVSALYDPRTVLPARRRG